MNKKCQVGIETIFIISGLLILFIVISLGFIEKTNEVTESQRFLAKTDVCINIANAISSAYSKGEGTVIKISAKDHKIDFDGNNQRIVIDDSYDCDIPLASISDGTNSSFTFESQELRLENKENTVFINQNCYPFPVDFAQK